MKKLRTKAWQQYSAGLEYKRKIGLYETVRQNERFYRGNQWYGAENTELPKPVFNVIRRIVDYLICTVSSGNISISYSAENLPYADDEAIASLMRRAVGAMTKNAGYRWERAKMDKKVISLLTDAALSGDGVLYCWWNPATGGGAEFTGDISTEVIDNVNLFVADVNRADIQTQDYIIISGRESVAALRAEAARYGASADVIAKILPDGDTEHRSGDMGQFELGDVPGDTSADNENDERKATCIIKFWREDGRVVFEKSTEDAVIRRQNTGLTLYPVAYFNWLPTKSSFHGTSPVSGMIPNQKFINRAFAMVMKHMTDTAFSKVVYDKSRIPEWTNGVGEAIAAVGGTNVADAVSVVGVGRMQDGYLELIELAVRMTKEMMGASESALGDGDATNTSAILALQEAARIPLETVRRSFYQCIEDLANIWADMILAYYPDGRLLPVIEDGVEKAEHVSYSILKSALLKAKVDVGEIGRYGASGTLSMLNRLIDGGHITAEQYIARLPAGLISDRDVLLEEITKKAGAAAAAAGTQGNGG